MTKDELEREPYAKALVAAGAVVRRFESFGSYQGDWWAYVSFRGRDGWVTGSYGSCSGCDAFKAEFGWPRGERCEDHHWDDDAPELCKACLISIEAYGKRLAEFGSSYLAEIMSQEEAEKKAAVNMDWDMEAVKMVDFVKAAPRG